MRSFIGSYKILARVLKGAAIILDPLEVSTVGAESGRTKIQWTDELLQAFHAAQALLKTNKAIRLPHSEDVLWLVTDGATTCQGLGATLSIQQEGHRSSTDFGILQCQTPCNAERMDPVRDRGTGYNSQYPSFQPLHHPVKVQNNCIK